ncbi:unnamed protein product [Alopecurus aequalis]
MADEIPNRGRLPSILLARKPFFTASKNATTATARSEDGYLMSVSFWMANPPEMSLFSIHCSKPQDLQHMTHSNFSTLPRVVGADGPFVLLRAAFYCGSHEYFLYTAGDHPRLERIPSPGESDDDLQVEVDESDDDLQVELGILGLGGGDNYLLADLRSSECADGYLLRIYSSETKSWSTRRLRNPCPGIDRVIPDKVITLGQGALLGWVDLSRGLLVCDLLLLLQHQDQDPLFLVLAIGRYYLPNDFDHHPGYDHEHPFRACTLSRHMNMTPGNQVSECHKIKEDSSSANHPSKTSIRVGSCEPRTVIQRLSELAGKNKRPRSSH